MGKFSNAISSIPASAVKEHDANFQLQVLQQPLRARACGYSSKFTGRRIVDPPPVIKISLLDSDGSELIDHSLGMFILTAELIKVDSTTEDDIISNETSFSTNQNLINSLKKKQQQQQQLTQSNISNLFGSTSVSATITNNNNNNNNELKAFFVFGDLSIRFEGLYKFKFTLYEYSLFNRSKLVKRNSIFTDSFQAYSAKDFPGLASSPLLIRQVSELGCRVRVRNISGGENKIKKARNSKKFLDLTRSKDRLPRDCNEYNNKNINRLTLSNLPLALPHNYDYNYNHYPSSEGMPKSATSEMFNSSLMYGNGYQSPISENVSPLMETFNHENISSTGNHIQMIHQLQSQQATITPSQQINDLYQMDHQLIDSANNFALEHPNYMLDYGMQIQQQQSNGNMGFQNQLNGFFPQLGNNNLNESVSLSSSPVSASLYTPNMQPMPTSQSLNQEASHYFVEQQYNQMLQNYPVENQVDKNGFMNMMMMMMMSQNNNNINNTFNTNNHSMNQNIPWMNESAANFQEHFSHNNDHFNLMSSFSGHNNVYNVHQ